MYSGSRIAFSRGLWLDSTLPSLAGFNVCQLVSLSEVWHSKFQNIQQQQRHMVGVVERSEATFLSVDEAPYRLREALYNRSLWRQAFSTGREHVFENLSEHFKPIQVWQNAFTHLIGMHNVKNMLDTKKGRARYESEILAIRNAVVEGEFKWLGEGGLFIQGDIRKGLEPRIVRSDMKEMEELVEKEARRQNKKLVDPGKKLALDAYFQDRLVQEMMRMILEPTFETVFSPRSHGFRPGRTQITCLKQVARDYREALWFWKGDLRSLFDFCIQNRPVFKQRMLEIIGKRVDDEKFLSLLDTGIATWALFSKEDVIHEDGYSPLNVKSGILPLMCNIYFSALDAWVEKRIPMVHCGRMRRVNPERAALILQGNIRLARSSPMYDPFDPHFTRLAYTRFADDFMFGVAGSKHLFHQVTDEFREFAEEHLRFPLPRVEVKHIKKRIPFLGHIVRMRGVPEREKVEKRKERTQLKKVIEGVANDFDDPMEPDQVADMALKDSMSIRTVLKRSNRQIFSVDGDADKIIRLLARAGYCHKNGDPIPNFKHMHFPQSETNVIIRKILLSVCDFYQVARNRQRLVTYCGYVVRHSLAKMYAAKFKLRSRAKVFRRSGRWLDKRIKVGKGFIGKIDPDTGERMKEQYVQIPYARISEVPKPDFTMLPVDWEPAMITELRQRALRTPLRTGYSAWGGGRQQSNINGSTYGKAQDRNQPEFGQGLGVVQKTDNDSQGVVKQPVVREEWDNENKQEAAYS